MESKEKVATLEKVSENPFTLFPKRETKKAEPSGIATNNGNKLRVTGNDARFIVYPRNLLILVISKVPYFSYILIAMATIKTVTAKPMTILVKISA